MAALADAKVESLKADVLEMFKLARDSLEKSVLSLDDRDEDLARLVIGRDRDLNALEAQVDRACLELLAEKMGERPFRTVAATFRLAGDVERIGDYSVAIAEVTLAVSNKPVTTTSLSLITMSHIALGMLDQCIKAYGAGGHIDTQAIFGDDTRIDRLYEEIFAGAIASILHEPGAVTNTMYVTVASRALERIGDHITNIAEDIAYIETGKLDRRDEAVCVPRFP